MIPSHRIIPLINNSIFTNLVSFTSETVQRESFNSDDVYKFPGSDTINNCDTMQERQERRIRQIRRQVDWQWLNACLGKFNLNR